MPNSPNFVNMYSKNLIALKETSSSQLSVDMKTLQLIVVFADLHCVLSKNSCERDSIVSSAINGILLNYFANCSWPISYYYLESIIGIITLYKWKK